jgi:retron-type reverse transcriptase
MQEVKEGFNKKHSTLAVYEDFRTAFDTVDRKRLLQKVEAMEIPENLYRWVKIFLSQRFMRVKYNGKASIYRQTRSGVPQGAVLSPTLFLIYINDLAAYIQERRKK